MLDSGLFECDKDRNEARTRMRTAPRSPSIRFRVEPGDVPPEKAARRLHLTLDEFEACKFRLFSRGFPRPDPDTGMYDLEAVDRWRRSRHPRLHDELTAAPALDESRHPSGIGMGDRIRAAKERKGHVRAAALREGAAKGQR